MPLAQAQLDLPSNNELPCERRLTVAQIDAFEGDPPSSVLLHFCHAVACTLMRTCMLHSIRLLQKRHIEVCCTFPDLLFLLWDCRKSMQ